LEEIASGVYHWTALHPRIKVEVSSYYVEGSGTLIDPMLPDPGVEWFRSHEPPQRIILTNRHHYRDSDALRGEFGCPVLCNEAGLHEFEDGPEVDGFRFGDRVAPGITALEVGAICPEETALHIEVEGGMLSFADALIRHGELGFVGDRLLGDDPEHVKRGILESLRGLLERDFDSLLFAHGDPLVGGGKAALREYVEAASAG
jgi:glyoxylase-like metal-dependent hydrolase (beta-lactamase superfamily II)